MIRTAVLHELARRQLTQTKLSRMTGILQPNLSAWLRGRKEMSVPNVERVMQALKLQVK